jgi:hypothetical protein
MIIKTGDVKTAVKIYELAQASPNYDTWEFKPLLESRIRNAERNTQVFNDRKQSGMDNVMITNSGNLCMSCHKMSARDKEQFKNYDWPAFFKKTDIYSIKGLGK